MIMFCTTGDGNACTTVHTMPLHNPPPQPKDPENKFMHHFFWNGKKDTNLYKTVNTRFYYKMGVNIKLFNTFEIIWTHTPHSTEVQMQAAVVLFKWVLGIWTQALKLVWQAFYWLSHVPSPFSNTDLDFPYARCCFWCWECRSYITDTVSAFNSQQSALHTNS